jgi:hypothetical protein
VIYQEGNRIAVYENIGWVTGIRLHLGRRCPVTVGVAIASQLTRNRRRMPFQPRGNFRLAAMRTEHLGYPFALLKSKMTCHHGDSVQRVCSENHPIENPRDVFTKGGGRELPVPRFSLKSNMRTLTDTTVRRPRKSCCGLSASAASNSRVGSRESRTRNSGGKRGREKRDQGGGEEGAGRSPVEALLACRTNSSDTFCVPRALISSNSAKSY